MPRFFTKEYARIKIRAAANGMTMAALAAKCGITRQALEMNLKGGKPNLDRQLQLSDLLGVELKKLFAPLTNGELIAAALWYAGLERGRR